MVQSAKEKKVVAALERTITHLNKEKNIQTMINTGRVGLRTFLEMA